MVSTGDSAPDISATVANGEVEAFELSDHIGDGPIVLAFFPGAFTPPCSNEMVALQEHIGAFEDAGATLLGVSADSAFSQNAFREEHGLEFSLLSDMGGDAIQDYGVEIDIEDLGLLGVANRSVFVIDNDGEISYSWVADDPTNEPDYDERLDAAQSGGNSGRLFRCPAGERLHSQLSRSKVASGSTPVPTLTALRSKRSPSSGTPS